MDVITGLPCSVVEMEFEEIVGAFVVFAKFGGTCNVINLPQYLT